MPDPSPVLDVPVDGALDTSILSELQPADRATICEVGGNGALRKRLLDMGVVPGAEIEVIRIAPLGDPVEYMVKGYRLSLRRSEAACVLVRHLPCARCLNEDCPRHGRGRRPRRWRRWRRRWLDWLEGRPNPARAGLAGSPEDDLQVDEAHDALG